MAASGGRWRLAPQEREFLQASLAQRRAEERTRLRATRQLRVLATALALLRFVAAGTAVYAFAQRGQARQDTRLADSRAVAEAADELRGLGPPAATRPPTCPDTASWSAVAQALSVGSELYGCLGVPSPMSGCGPAGRDGVVDKAVNYDVGMRASARRPSRPDFDPVLARRELQIIKQDLVVGIRSRSGVGSGAAGRDVGDFPTATLFP